MTEILNEVEWPHDPDWIKWLEERRAEAIQAMEADAEIERNMRRDYWLKRTAENGEPPC